METVMKLAPPPPPSPPRDYTADETCAAESLLMLFPCFNPSAATNSITPAAAAKKTTQELPAHTCDVCGAGFKSYQALGGHKTLHRPKPTTTTAAVDRVFECSVCHARFSSGQALGGHKRKHFEGEIICVKNKRSCKTSSGESRSGVTTAKDEDDARSSFLDFDLNLPYTHIFFE